MKDKGETEWSSFLMENNIVSIVEISKQYGMTEWHEDIKSVLRKASSSDQHGVFLFTDSQV
ncbi:unnamed protein product [Timema podura]|uniref:Dynein heavy chain AAA module D4 domain-containing protein n=1 Tax=Timema podura TaxID=61482 RepID=A0ABN7P5T9_TIMPD|nr:unnamed protein product [Timema podura]